MEIVHPKCAGLDVHQQTVVACARVSMCINTPSSRAPAS